MRRFLDACTEGWDRYSLMNQYVLPSKGGCDHYSVRVGRALPSKGGWDQYSVAEDAKMIFNSAPYSVMSWTPTPHYRVGVRGRKPRIHRSRELPFSTPKNKLFQMFIREVSH